MGIVGSKMRQSADVLCSEKWIDMNGDFSSGSVSALRSKLRTVSRENMAVKSQLEELKKKERLNLIADRAATETSNRMKSLNTEYRKTMKLLDVERDVNHQLQSEIVELRGQRSQLEESERFLKSE